MSADKAIVYQMIGNGPSGQDIVIEYWESAPQSEMAWIIEPPRRTVPKAVVIRALPEMPEVA